MFKHGFWLDFKAPHKLQIKTFIGGRKDTLVKSLTGSYPVDLAHSLVETRLISPSSLDARALASASAGSPINEVLTK